MKKVMTANDRKIQFATMVEEKFTLAWPTARNCGDRSKLCAKLAQQLGGHVVGHVVKIMHKQ